MVGDYIIKRIDESKLQDLVILYKNVFNLRVTENYLKKKYDTSFTGHSYIGYIAYDSESVPAAYYGVFPCLLTFKGEKILAAQSADTMTHTNHRGKGLFIKLAQETFCLAKEEGIELIFGFPNKNSYPGFVNKLAWKHIENIQLYKIKVFTVPISRIVKKFSFLKPIYNVYCNCIMTLFNSANIFFKGSINGSEHVCVLRDKFFFEYKKYSQKYLVNLKKIVWLKIDGVLQIGDVENSTHSEFYAVISKLKILSFFLGSDCIYFHVSPGTLYNEYLSVKYKSVESLPYCALELTKNVDVKNIKFTTADFDTF